MFSDPLSQLPPPAWRWSLPSLAAQLHVLPRLHHGLPPRKLDWASITRSGRNKQPRKSSQYDHRWLWHLAKYIEASCSVLKLANLIMWMLQILPPDDLTTDRMETLSQWISGAIAASWQPTYLLSPCLDEILSGYFSKATTAKTCQSV